MPKVTESLRRTWGNQVAQMREEREFTQSGRRRSPEDTAIVDFDIAVQDKLLSLPVGARFDTQAIAEQVRQELGEVS